MKTKPQKTQKEILEEALRPLTKEEQKIELIGAWVMFGIATLVCFGKYIIHVFN